MKTKQLYYQDQYLDKTEAKVLVAKGKGSKTEVILDQTIFYPGGGGQPYDLGTINGFEVEKVFMIDGEIVHRVVGSLMEGQEIEIQLDFNRRLHYMKIHSAGHLIHDVLSDLVDNLKPVKGEHGDDAYLQYLGSVDDLTEKELEKEVNKFVKEDLNIITKDVTYEELEKEVEVMQPGVPKNKRLRMLKIGNFGAMADGGIQVRSTKEIGKVKISEILQEGDQTTINYSVENETSRQENKINFYISSKVKAKFPDLDEVVMPIYGIDNTFDKEILTKSDFEKSLLGKSDEEFYSQKELVDFRKFCEDLDINLKRFPPSVEFLFKRFQKNGKVPQINSVVDCANKVAVETLVATGVFDLDQIKGGLVLRFSEEGEEFRPLGGDIEHLSEGLVVISDDEKILNLFPFRDSIYQKITKDTKDILILADKVPGGNLDDVKIAVERVGDLIQKHCGGKIGEMSTSEVRSDIGSVVSVEEVEYEVGTKRRVFSGTRATGKLHLGNYLGAVKGYLELQENPNLECVFMAVDIHTITTPYDHKIQPKATRSVIMDYLACGLDPKKVIVTVQSMVPEHTELAFLFSSVITVARMQHLPTFKDKVKQHPNNVTMALLNYPVLMAADILIYKAGLVPVGIDQEPHLEVAREIARKMNDLYGTDFLEPKRFVDKGLPAGRQGEYVPSLTGEGKMSKSVEGSFINLTDDLEIIKSKLAKVPTDSGSGNKVPDSGGVATLMTLIDLFIGANKRLVYEEQYISEGIKYSELKDKLAEAIYKELKPIQEKRKELEANPDYVEKVIKDGAEKARKIASQTIKEVKEKMGLI